MAISCLLRVCGTAAKGPQLTCLAASHTGAMAGSDTVFDAAIRRAGMLRVDTLQDLFMAAQTLARFHGDGPHPEAGLTIMTNGGGAGVMAADAAELAGIPLREMTPGLRQRLRRCPPWQPEPWSQAQPAPFSGNLLLMQIPRQRAETTRRQWRKVSVGLLERSPPWRLTRQKYSPPPPAVSATSSARWPRANRWRRTRR